MGRATIGTPAAGLLWLLAVATSGVRADEPVQPVQPVQPAQPAPPAGPPAALSAGDEPAAAELAKEFADRLQRSRYMESKQVKDAAVAGWEEFPTKRYTYSVKDRDGTVKTADVVLLDAPAERIARWIVSALVEVKGSYEAEEGRKVFKHILAQSGGQFPVAGVVYEDILPEDGRNETYCFRDGVTVEVEGVEHRSTRPLTPPEVEASISGKVTRVFTYARIQSTSPKQWIDAGGSPGVMHDGRSTEQWLEAVRAAYQKAWASDRNGLVVAWVKGNIK